MGRLKSWEVRVGWLEWGRRGSSWGRKGWSWLRRILSQEVGFGEVKGVGGLGSEEFGSRGRVEIKEVGGVGVRGWVWEVGVGVREVGGYERLGAGGVESGVGLGRLGSGGLGLRELVGIRGFGVGGKLGSKELE